MRKTITILLTLLLTGCSGVPTIPGIGPYKIDVQQGNVLTQEMVGQLKPGQTRDQVRFILGTPLVVDVFHSNRWDYVYVYEKGGKVTEHRKLAVIFENDKLARIEGDVIAAGGDKPAAGSAPVSSDKAAGPGEPQKAAPAGTGAVADKPQEEKGFFGRMLDKIGF